MPSEPHDESLGERQEQPTVFAGGRRPDAPEAELSSPEEVVERLTMGTTLGRHVLLDELGRGGMGRVLRAYDPKLGREVAIKRLHSRRASGTALRRMLQEAYAMARLTHPNVVAIYDVHDEDDDVWITMELVAGVTLAAWLKEDRSWREILRVFGLAGEGLAAAHAAGLVHRDFKPSNVLVSNDGQIKVADFGIAKGLGSEASEGSDGRAVGRAEELTSASTVMGTPLYMAPEQAMGRDVDARSDQYSFCVALWQALARRSPFEGPAETLTERKRKGPPPLPARLRVSRAIAVVLERGLAPRPEDRFASMRALCDALERGLRPRRWLPLGLAGLGAAGVAMVLSTRTAPDPCADVETELASVWNETRGELVDARVRATAVPYAGALAEQLRASASEFAEAWTVQRREVCESTLVRGDASAALMGLRTECLTRARQDFDARVDALLTVDASTIARAHTLMMRPRMMERCAEAQRLIAEEVMPSDEAARAALRQLHARLARAAADVELGRDDAVERLRGLAEEADALGSEPMQVELDLWLARALGHSGDLERAESVLRRATSTAIRTRASGSIQETSIALAQLLSRSKGLETESRLYADLALSMARRTNASPDAVPRALVAKGTTLHRLGDLAASAEAFEQALAWWDERGGDEPERARAEAEYAEVLGAMAS